MMMPPIRRITAVVSPLLVLIAQARAGHVVYLTGPGDDDVVAIAPVEVVTAGLAALGRTEDGTGS